MNQSILSQVSFDFTGEEPTPADSTPATPTPVVAADAVPVAEPVTEPVAGAVAEVVAEPAIGADDSIAEEPSIIATLGGLLGYEIEGDFSDDYEGLARYTRAVAEHIAQSTQEAEAEEMPDVAEYREFRRNGGRPEDYFGVALPETDYATLNIAESNTDLQRNLITQVLTAQSYSPEDIEATLNVYEDAGALHKQSLIAKNILTKHQQTEKQSMLETQRQQAETSRQQIEQYWTGIQTTLETGKLGAIQVPDADRKGFFEWLSKPIDAQGNSQRTLDKQKAGQENLLALEYLAYKKFDIAQLAKQVATTKIVGDLRSKLNPAPSAAVRTQNAKPGTGRAQALPSLETMF